MATNKRSYEMTLNVNSSVNAPTMSLYNTDQNIFDLKVYIEATVNGRVQQLTHDELANYGLKLQVVKPTSNQYKEVQGVLDGTEGFYLFEMPKDTFDAVGTYKCQLVITDNKGTADNTTDDEIVTSKDFSYTVVASIVTNLNPLIKSNPDLPVLEQLINEVKLAAGLTVDDPNTIIGGLTIPGLDTTAKTLQGAINEINNKSGATDNNYTNVDKAKVDKIGNGTLGTTAQDIIGAINELNNKSADVVDNLTSTDTNKALSAKQGKVLKDSIGDLATLKTTEKDTLVGAINELNDKGGTIRKDLNVVGNAVTMDKDADVQNITSISSDTEITLPANVQNKEIVLNIDCDETDRIITFKNGAETSKVKLAADSHNVFVISANGADFIMQRKSTEYPELTPDEIADGVLDEDLSLTKFQTIEEKSLTTTAKTIPGAINELKTTVDSSTTDNNYSNADKTKVDKIGTATLTTTNKTILEAINELDTRKATTTSLGSVQIGDGIKVDSNGIISVKDELKTTSSTLTTDKYQSVSLTGTVSVTLPTVTEFTELHVFVSVATDVPTVTFPAGIKWQEQPTLESDTTYELIFTYVGGIWLAGYIAYK